MQNSDTIGINNL